MPRIYVKCPECGKRGLTYTTGEWRGERPKMPTGKITEKEVNEWRRMQQEGVTWDVKCRYCGLKKNIFHQELLALQDADPVFMQKERKQLERLGGRVAQRMSDMLGIPVTVQKDKDAK